VGLGLLHRLCRFHNSRFFWGEVVFPITNVEDQELMLLPAWLSGALENANFLSTIRQ
jgi:hypothetical protein